MALRLAVVISQAPGLGGTPSLGQRPTAAANASAADSSAMSRSLNRLVKAATTRAHSSRCAWLIACSTSLISIPERRMERPQLDLPIANLRPLGRELERHVQVGRLDDPKAGQELLRLQEGTVTEDRLLTARVHDRRRARPSQAVGKNPVA